MIELYGGLLMLLALTLALWPFVRPRTGARQDRSQTVRAIYRGRLRELDAELINGQLARDTRIELEQELGAALLEDFADASGEEAELEPKQTGSRLAWLVVAGLLPMASTAIYLSLGDPGVMELEGAAQSPARPPRR